MFPLLLLTISSAVAEPWCYTDGVTCPSAELLGRSHGVVDAYECSTICGAQHSCTAFTLWGRTSLIHWEECWTFSSCSEEEACDECTTGTKSGDCSSTTRTTSQETTATDATETTVSDATETTVTDATETTATDAPDTTVTAATETTVTDVTETTVTDATETTVTDATETTVTDTTVTDATDTTSTSNSCPALPQDGGSWICIPEVLPGEQVPEEADCIFSCGHGSTLHTCQGGEMSPPVPAGCYCPPLDLPPQGGLVCAPPLLQSGEGRQGAVCIFSCGQHPQLEMSCNEGVWDTDLDLLVC